MVVVEEAGFTRASARLCSTQPAISSQVKVLEKQLGVQLIERGERGLSLTAEGELYLQYARELLALEERARTALGELQGLRIGKVLIGASTTPGEFLLPAMLGSFRRRYPGIETTLAIAPTGDIVRQLVERRLEICVVGARVEHPSLNFEPLWHDKLIVVTGASTPLAKKGIKGLDDLLGQDLVLRESNSGTRMILEQRLDLLDLSVQDFHQVLELGSVRAVITAVEAGMGFSLVSALAVDSSLSLGRVVELHVPELSSNRPLFMAVNKSRLLSSAATALIDFFQKYAGIAPHEIVKEVISPGPKRS